MKNENYIPSFFNSPRTLAISTITAVPDDGSAAPYPHASLWLPTKTIRSIVTRKKNQP